MITPAVILTCTLLAAAPHPGAAAPHRPNDVQGRMAPSALRIEIVSSPEDSAGACEGSLSPIGVILPAGASSDCGAPIVLRHEWRDGAPGTFVFLDLPSCPDSWCRALPTSDKLRCEILIGNPCCWLQNVMGTELQALPGNRIGPVTDALQGRFDADTDLRQNVCYARYSGNTARVLRVLVVEPASTQGRSTFRVVSEGRLFLRSRQDSKSDDLVCEMVPVSRPSRPSE